MRLAAYRFDKYRTKEKPEKKPSIAPRQIAVDDPKAAAKAFKRTAGLADAIIFARDLVSEPANILYPEEFARRVKKLTALGLEVEILGEKEMKKLGMGALLGVGQGSVRESQLAVIQWKGAKDPAAQPIAFVGKGVCFDTGGISIKPRRRHGGDDHRHGRGRGGERRDVRARRPQGQGQRRRHPGPGREHARRKRPAPGRRGQDPCPARPSR